MNGNASQNQFLVSNFTKNVDFVKKITQTYVLAVQKFSNKYLNKWVFSFFLPCFVLFFFFLISYFTWVFIIQVLSPVLPRSPGPECTKQFDCRDGFSLLVCFFLPYLYVHIYVACLEHYLRVDICLVIIVVVIIIIIPERRISNGR